MLVSLVDNNDKVDNRHPIIDMAEVDIDKYLPEAQPYILKAIQGKYISTLSCKYYHLK